MKIAMLGHKRIPSREGGVEIVVEELAAGLTQRGHEVTAYNRKGRHVSTGVKEKAACKTRFYRGIRIIAIPTFEKKSLNAVVYAFFASVRALFGHYDVVHFHAEGPCCMLWLMRLFRIPTVATIHGLDWQRAKWGGFATRFLLFGEKMAAKYADQVIVLSENVRQYFKETYGRETVFIPNGISRPETRQADIIYRKYGLKKDTYLLFLARLVPEKGVHYLLDAYAKLDTDKKLVIAGGGSHSGGYMEELERRVKDNGNILMTGFVEGAELEEIFSNAYLYILPSDVEGMPLSLLEAMSYGNCCLVSDIPENVDVAGENGVSFKRGNTEDLREKLQSLLCDQDRVDRIKSAAADYICEKYRWDDVVEETLALYGKVKK